MVHRNRGWYGYEHSAHNLREVINAVIKIIDNQVEEDRETTIEELLEIIKGPDFLQERRSLDVLELIRLTVQAVERLKYVLLQILRQWQMESSVLS